MKKNLLFTILSLLLLFLLVGCAPTAPEKPAESAVQPEATTQEPMLELTLELLKTYNGKNNMPAYVAFEGKIYDVTNHPKWPNGEHNGRVSAGMDITEAINSAPHGTTKIKDLKQVGILK